MRRWILCAACIVCGARAHAQGGASTAGAASPAPAPPLVLVAEQPCQPARYDSAALWKALQVELGELSVHAERMPAGDEALASQAASAALAVIGIGCAPEPSNVWLRVSDAASGKELTRVLGVTDVAEAARSRALALAVVALLESSWSEVLAAGTPAGTQDTLPPAVQAVVRERLSRKLASNNERPPLEEPSLAPVVVPTSRAFETTATMRGFPGRSTGMLGLQLGWLPNAAATLRAALSIEALWGRSELSDANGRVGVMQLYWLTAGGGLSWHTGNQIELEGGPRVLVGYGAADPHATRAGAKADSGSGVVVSALLEGSVRAPLWGVQIMTGVDIGYTIVGIVFLGDQARLSGMADVTFALRSGVAW